MKHLKPKFLAIILFCLGLTGLNGQWIKDVDGNSYNTVLIGTQRWMAENLKTTKYNDYTAIPLVVDNNAWSLQTAPAYCWYNNDKTKYKTVYGALYNWYTVNTGKLCPKGWHVPTDTEWGKLASFGGHGARINNLGTVVSQGGGDLKAIDTTYWKSPNGGATNKYGFTGLPGGERSLFGQFIRNGIHGFWWTSTRYGEDQAYVYELYYFNMDVPRGTAPYYFGKSVRCLKD